MTETKEKLICAAQDLLHKQSYGAVSVDDICKTAGVNKGSFYHFFKSKSDLIVASLKAHQAETIAFFNNTFSPILTPTERFDRLVNEILTCQAQYLEETGFIWGCDYSSLGAEVAGAEPKIQAKVLEIMDNEKQFYRTAILDMIDRGDLPKSTDATMLADVISAFITGQLNAARIRNNLDHLETQLRYGIQHILRVPSCDTHEPQAT